MKKLLRGLLILLVVLGLVGFGLSRFVGRMMEDNTDAILSNVFDTEITVENLQDLQLPPMSPQTFVDYLNSYADNVADLTHGFISQAQATVSGNRISYDLVIDNIPAFGIDFVINTNYDYFRSLGEAILDSIVASGTSHPILDFNIKDSAGNILRTLTFER